MATVCLLAAPSHQVQQRPASDQLVHRVVSTDGRATVLLSNWTRLLARTETS